MGGVNAAAFSPDGKWLLTAGADGKARLWDAVTFAPHGRPLEHGGAFFQLAFSPDSRRAMTVGHSDRMRLWSIPDGRLVATPPADSPPHHAAFSPDGRTAVLAWERNGARSSGATARRKASNWERPARSVAICVSRPFTPGARAS